MDRARVKFTFVTPCITSGADKLKAELRIPSIRGQLIWWARALGVKNIENIFGGVSGEAKASSLVIRDFTDKIEISCADGGNISGNRFDYLLWPMRGTRENPRAGERGFIKEGQSIELELYHRKFLHSETLPDKVLKAFLILGSLGTRSRRCYGSVYPQSLTIDNTEWRVPQNLENLKKELESIIPKQISCKIILISTPVSNCKTAVEKCSLYLKNFRAGKTAHGTTASEWGANDHDAPFNNEVDCVFRPAIGLPLKQSYRSNRRNYDIEVSGYERLASPLHLKVIKLCNQYYPLAIFFPDHSIQQDTEIMIKERGNYIKKLPLDQGLLENMMKPDPEYWNEPIEVLFDSYS